MHYIAAGSSGPALLLLHESPLSSRIFAPALPHLSQRVRAWALDTPGYGMSDALPARSPLADYAECVLDVANALGLETFALVGTHTGASIALEIASGAGRERVTHLVLSGLAGLPQLTEEQRSEFFTSMAPTFDLTSTGEHLGWLWKRFGRLWGEDAPPELLNEGVAAVIGNLRQYNVAYDSVFDYDPAPGLAKIQCPLLLLNATGDRYAFADASVVKLAPHARVVHLPGLSGALPWQLPQVYADHVLGFLSERA